MLRAHQRDLMSSGGESFGDCFYIHLRTTTFGISGVAPVEESHAKQSRS
jgi:hypothetical protein